MKTNHRIVRYLVLLAFLTFNLQLSTAQSVTVDFGTLSSGDSGDVVSSYLAGFGITVTGITPGGGLFINTVNPGVFDGPAGQMFLQWGGPNGDWNGFTLNFDQPLTALSFTRIGEGSDGNGLAWPAWNATVYQGDTVIGTASENAISIFPPNSIPAQTYDFTGTGITSITFLANDFNFSFTGTPGIGDIVMTPVPEPSTWAMLTLGFGTLLSLRRLKAFA